MTKSNLTEIILVEANLAKAKMH
ncbi:MAG: hypothetical protein AB8W78_08940 [Arsenophonus endosymbiont of Dermacentor nuttalli]